MSVEDLEHRCSKLRQKLKQWEAAFAVENDGHKPGKEDVKRNPDIAQRYKDYHKIRDKLSAKPTHTATSPTRSKRKLLASEPVTAVQTPSKAPKLLGAAHPSVIDPYDPPIAFLLSPSQQKSIIGPTPQKDGQLLGMFDGLSSHRSKATPGKRRALDEKQLNILVTPSKPHQTPTKVSAGKEPGLRRTQSLGNLDVKATPSSQSIAARHTPGSSSKLRRTLRFDDTPAFLRRDSLHVGKPLADDGAEADKCPSFSPFAARLKRQSSARSLSAIMQDLREEEEERLDEEFDMMREMEEDDETENASSRRSHVPRLLVEDSQVVDMPLGPDREQKSDVSSDEDGDGTKLGQPTKVWKKRGQKRSTRHVKMKPITAKWQPEAAWKGDRNSDEERDKENGEPAPGDKEKKPKAKRKISATAHANFRALKIRNKNSKFKKGGSRRNR